MRFSICDWTCGLLAACGLAVVLSPGSATAQSKWTLTTAEFRTRQVEIASIDAGGVTPVGDAPIQWEDLLLLDRQDATMQPGAAKFTLYLVNGDQLRGEPVKLEGETLQFATQALGAIAVSLKQVAGIVRVSQSAPAIDEKRTEDVVKLGNGDVVRGIIASLGDGAIKVQSQGNEVVVPLESVSSVLLATTNAAAGPGAPVAGRAFRARLTDDSVITASNIQSQADKLLLTTTDGAARSVPQSAVVGIEQLNGPVSWLSSRTPSEQIQTPLLETARPAKMDRTVTGRVIRGGEQTYSRGIGVAPYSKITWPLDGTYKAFRTQYAIDGSGAYADIAVRILLDGTVVHDKKDVTAGELSPVVVVPLGSAKSLALEVDFGANLNVQDRLNWIEAALVKTIPSAATQPAKSPPPATVPTTGLAQ